MMSFENVRKNGSKVCTAMCHLLVQATCMGIDFSLHLSLWSCEVLLLHWLQVRFCECEFRLCRAPAYQKCKLNSCVLSPSPTQSQMAQVNPPWADSSNTQYVGCDSFTIMESYFMVSVTVCSLLLISFLVCRTVRKTLTWVMYPCTSAQFQPSWLELILVFVLQP